MTHPILVTGGTGTLGTRVVRLLTEHGVPVRVLSRRPRSDTPSIGYAVGDALTRSGPDAAFADGDDLAGPDADRGVVTREQWLHRR